MKQTRKIVVCLLLVGILSLLWGCGGQETSGMEESTTQATVSDIFTVPETDPTETDATQETEDPIKELLKQKFMMSLKVPGGMSYGFHGGEGTDLDSYYVYQGGELPIQLYMKADGFSDMGVGALIFLDGQPQPYRTADEENYSYMHTFYPEDDVPYVIDAYMIPVTGQAGDTLEIYTMCVAWPDYFLNDAPVAFQHTCGSTGGGMKVKFQADPPAQELPEPLYPVISCTTEFEDLESWEITDWSTEDLRHKVEWEFTINGIEAGGDLFGYSGEEPLTLRYEIWGGTAVEYGLILYIDNQPVCVDEEQLHSVELKNGKKTIIEVQVDMSGYDGSSVVYGVLAAKNFYSGGANQIFIESRPPFYLCSSPTFDDLMGW